MQKANYIRNTEAVNMMGDRIFLYYFIHESHSAAAVGEGRKYGIGIDMYTQLPDERTVKERSIVESVFKTKIEAELFIDVLCKGSVTPSSLEDIIEDNVAI